MDKEGTNRGYSSDSIGSCTDGVTIVRTEKVA